ncbi:MAG TPA: PorT family protein [Flavobacteriales bacterium]|nr:PorT family protein [Flavobacteriales bacterium]
MIVNRTKIGLGGICFALSLAFTAVDLSAQTDYSEGQAFRFNGGFIGGVTTSQIHGDGIGGFNKMGVNAGVTLEIGRNGKKNIQLGIVYNQKGSKKPPNPRAGDYETWRYRFTYIDIPITVSYNYQFFDLLLGLQPSVLLAAEEDFYGVAWDPTGLPIKDYDLCGVFGIRTQYGDHSHLFGRVTQSILAIAPRPDNPSGTVRWNNRMLNMTVEIGFTYLFGNL